MKLIIENTTKTVLVNDVPARIWEGHTESGIAVHCFIALVAVRGDLDCSQFDRELQERKAPSAEAAAIPLRMVL